MALAEYGNALNIDTDGSGNPILVDPDSGDTIATYDRGSGSWVIDSLNTEGINYTSPNNAATAANRNVEFRWLSNTLTDNAGASLLDVPKASGYVKIVRTSAVGDWAEFELDATQGSEQVRKVSDSASSFSTTEGEEGAVSVYWSDTNSRFEIKNALGGTLTSEALAWVVPQ